MTPANDTITTADRRTISPERIAELMQWRASSRELRLSDDERKARTMEFRRRLEFAAPILLDAAEENVALRAERDNLRKLLDDACEDESEIHRRLDAALPPDTLLTVQPPMGGRTPLVGDDGRVAQLVAENARLRDLLTRVQVEDRWRPISEAPKDGTRVILYAGDAVVMSRWVASWGEWMNGGDTVFDPTHWRPLPLTPAEEAELDALREAVAMEGETP